MLAASATLPEHALAGSSDGPTIIVTARRLEERLHDVPLAVDAIPSKEIDAASVRSLQSLSAHVPGLSFEALWGGWNSFPVLRGQNQPSVAGDAVGMFVDGVNQANRSTVDIEPLDLERIEVVKGPQSALFGHASFAGLIHYVPAQATEKPLLSGSADLGTDNFSGLRLILSGPVSSQLKGRVAAAWRSSDGSWENSAEPGQHLGNLRRIALAGTIATRDGTGPLGIRLSARYGEDRYGLAPSFPLDYRRFNCGGRDPASGAWSYYCGAAPLPNRVSLSTHIPDSQTRTGQVALHLLGDMGGVELRSDTSLYDGRSSAIRDLDGGAEGDLFGICLIGVNCTGPGRLSVPVIRLQRANLVLRRTLSVHETSQEVRLRSTGNGRFDWHIGGVLFWTKSRILMSIGAKRGALAVNERLTSLVLADPMRVGTLSIFNNALTDDPDADQFPQNDFTEFRRTMALFAAAQYRLGQRVRLRSEARGNWERLALDSRLSQFAPSFGKSIGARHFFDLTPRISVDYRPNEQWLAYASHARGSRSGGINPVPNLLPEEQVFEPETNWTSEIGVKYAGRGVLRSFQATGYHIDWRNTQILGFPLTPGVGLLTTRNIRGIETWGIELTAEVVPAPWLSLEAAYSHARPRFKPGSEDAGSSDLCGLTVGTTSTLCRVVSSASDARRLVPDISGNRPERSMETSWTAIVTFAPPATTWHGLHVRAEVSHQSNVFERQANGLYYGARTLLSARLAVPLGAFTAELWGTNLTNEHYAQGAAPRAPIYYVAQPRPVDLILANGRRLGITLRYND